MNGVNLISLSVYICNKRALKSIKQNLVEMKIEITGIYTMIIRDFCIPLSIIARISNHKINKDIGDLNNTVNLLDPMYIYRTFHSTCQIYILFEHTRNFYQDRLYLGCKYLNNIKRVQVI